jgi:hypothetical protein
MLKHKTAVTSDGRFFVFYLVKKENQYKNTLQFQSTNAFLDIWLQY